MSTSSDALWAPSTSEALDVVPRTAAGRASLRRPRVRSWWRDAFGVSVWSSMLFVVSLWVAGGGVQELTQLGSGLTSVGRLSGLVASDLLLVQVLLMARIPFVEKSFGQDELARRHRLVGFSSFNLMVVHIVAITVGYAASTSQGWWGTIVDFVLNYPGMLLAVAGTVALVGVTVTSIKAARARVRYESWHLLHLYAYLGVGLALPHQLWTGREFLTSTPATVFWWTLWAAAAASVLVWRVGQPLWRSLRHQLVVEQVRAESDTVTTVVMRGRRLDRFAGAGRSVPSVAVPERTRPDPCPPLLVVRGSGRADPADHRGSSWGWLRGAGEPAPRDKGDLRGSIWPDARGGADPSQGPAHGLWHRHHADARTS